MFNQKRQQAYTYEQESTNIGLIHNFMYDGTRTVERHHNV